jgi:hypothetical protein
MKLLFLRSQLVDVEVGFRYGANFGDVQLGFDLRLGNRFDAGRRNRCGGLWFGMAGSGALGGRRRFGSDAADSFGDSVFERASRAGLEGHCRETCKDFESRGERGRRSLGAKHWWKRVSRFAAGAGGDYVVDGLLKFVAGALNALQVVAESASNGLFDGIGFRCHTRY